MSKAPRKYTQRLCKLSYWMNFIYLRLNNKVLCFALQLRLILGLQTNLYSNVNDITSIFINKAKYKIHYIMQYIMQSYHSLVRNVFYFHLK